MKKEAYKIDDNGFIIHVYIVDDTLKSDLIKESIPAGLYKPKWSGSEWVEGKTDEEFLEDVFLASLNPSAQDLAKAERDLETIELLIEMGLI